MGINARIAKIPFYILYLINAGFILFNWIRVIFLQRDFEVFRSEQPWDYFLADSFSKTFGTTHREYYIFTLPLILLGLFAFPKFVGKILNKDKKSNIKGDNHVAVILLLFIAPVTFGFHKLLGSGWRSHLVPGVILITFFSLLSWMDEKKKA